MSLLPCNETLIEIFCLVRNQVILSPEGKIVDLRLDVVLKLLALYKVEDTLYSLQRIRHVFWHCVERYDL